MRILFLFLVGLCTSQLLVAQVNVTEEIPEDSTQIGILEKLDVSRDARLDKMLRWNVEKNKKMEGMDGFRVEIFFSSRMDAHEQATKIKADFLSKYPENIVHIKFVAPNFRVRVGDFRTKNEALKLYKLIQEDYPAAFIVPDVIDFPLLKTNIYE